VEPDVSTQIAPAPMLLWLCPLAVQSVEGGSGLQQTRLAYDVIPPWAIKFVCFSPCALVCRSLHAEGGGTAGGNRSALIGRASRVAGLRAALARFLRDLVAAAPSMAASSTSSSSTTGVSAPAGIPAASTVAAVAATGVSVTGADDARSAPLRLLGPAPRLDYDPHTGRPTLLLVRDFSEQACLDAGAALDELQDLLALLSAPDTQLDDRTCAERLSEYGPAGGLASLAAAASSSAAAAGEASSSNGGSAADGLLLGAGGLAARRRLARHYLAMAASKLDALLGEGAGRRA
jgi:nuclear pore complex protein Nup205